MPKPLHNLADAYSPIQRAEWARDNIRIALRNLREALDAVDKAVDNAEQAEASAVESRAIVSHAVRLHCVRCGIGDRDTEDGLCNRCDEALEEEREDAHEETFVGRYLVPADRQERTLPGISAGTVVVYCGSNTAYHGLAVFIGPSGNYPAGEETRFTLLFAGRPRLEGVGRGSFTPAPPDTDIPPLVQELADAMRRLASKDGV